jgi:hypothetical protein
VVANLLRPGLRQFGAKFVYFSRDGSIKSST